MAPPNRDAPTPRVTARGRSTRYHGRFPSGTASPGLARRAVASLLESNDVDVDLRERVGLALSELCANAIEATDQPFSVTAAIGLDHTVDLWVTNLTDHAPELPEPTARPDATALRGRGLFIVNALADREALITQENENVTIHARFSLEPGAGQ